MSAEAARKAAMAAKQAGHAVNNLEAAAELQVDEVVQNVVQSVPFVIRHKNLMLVGAGFVAGAVVPPLAARSARKRLEKRRAKKDRKRVVNLVKDEAAKAEAS